VDERGGQRLGDPEAAGLGDPPDVPGQDVGRRAGGGRGAEAGAGPAVLGTGELRVPQDGAVAWTTHADLAEAIAHLLTDGRFDGRTPPLTGPEAIDMAGVAEIAARVTGRQIRRVVVPDQEYRQGLLTAGVPAPAADMLVGLFAASRSGDFGPADPALAGLLGRPATTIEDYLLTSLPAGPGR